ncbi:hypothetical protein E2C01_063268 [Portunus trituberculatus]|uniref:Uncharacterized protein n=1 Tax=Portunus trituberculatus TaxID=210409 RepID=A0A5B7HHP0_PORTR|nr:hypothetical protein [Portunus trituberculatus]
MLSNLKPDLWIQEQNFLEPRKKSRGSGVGAREVWTPTPIAEAHHAHHHPCCLLLILFYLSSSSLDEWAARVTLEIKWHKESVKEPSPISSIP